MNESLPGPGRVLVTAATLAVATATGAAAQDARNLTVEQTAMHHVQAPAAAATNPLGVVAWVDHPDNTYAVGERVRLFVQTNKDAYVTVLNVGPAGETTVLFPNRYQSDNLVRANTVTEVPDAAGRAHVTVTGPAGAELIKVFASSRPVPLFDAAQLGAVGPFRAVRGRAGQAARNLQVVMREPAGGEWDVYDKVIRTVPQPAAAVSPPASAVPVPVHAVAGASWPAPPFALQVAADRPLYRSTEPVTLMVRAEADCHLTLLNTGSGGASRMLFPNRYQQQTLIRAGQTVVVPGLGAGLSIAPLGPAGVEHVTAVCRVGERPALDAPAGFRSGVFPSLDDAGATARNLAIVADGETRPTAVAATSFVVVQ